MRVNQSASPNFQRLEIEKNPALVQALTREKTETLKIISEVGESLKNTMFYDVVLSFDKAKAKVVAKLESSKPAFFGSLDSKRFENIRICPEAGTIILSDFYDKEQKNLDVPKKITYNVWGPARKKYDSLEELGILADIALEMDKSTVQYYNKEIGAYKAKELY